jgi:hypothetical protein
MLRWYTASSLLVGFVLFCFLTPTSVSYAGTTYGASNIPMQAAYDITIQGVTASGNTAFPQRNTVYSPVQRFRLSGRLVVVPTQDRTGVTGINARDIAIISGNPSGNPQAGATWFATNTRVFAMLGLGNSIQRNAALNAANVRIDEATGRMSIAIDQSVARACALNSFNIQGGLVAGVYQITIGRAELQFYDSGSRIRGEINFIGTGYIGPSNTAISASITGSRR